MTRRVVVAVLIGLGAGCATLRPPSQAVLDSVYVYVEGPGRYNAKASLVLIQCADGARWPVTAAHVAAEIQHQYPIRAQDVARDVAVLELPASWTGPGLPLGRLPRRGDLVWLIHAPAGIANLLSWGMVARVSQDQLVVAGSGFGGSSGGAVVNRAGELVGILIGLRGEIPGWGLYQGALFAVAVPAIRAVLTTVDADCAAT